MGTTPNTILKFDTIKKYITLVGGILEKVKIKYTDPDTLSDVLITPMVRYATTNKSLYRIERGRTPFKLETSNDTWKYPIIMFKLDGMSYDTQRFSVSNVKFMGDITTTAGLERMTKFFKNPIPFDYNFTIEMHSNVLSHTFDFIENFVVYFNPANTFTIEIITSTDGKVTMVHDAVCFINSFEIPQAPEELDNNTHEAISTVKINLVVKGLLIPPLTDVHVIKYIKQKFIIEDTDELVIEETHPTP